VTGKMRVDLQGEGFFMPGAQRCSRYAGFSRKSFSEGCRIKGLSAYMAVNKSHHNDFIPLVCQHVLKFNGLLGTYAPAITAAGAAGHVVQERPLGVRVFNLNRIGRTIL